MARSTPTASSRHKSLKVRRRLQLSKNSNFRISPPPNSSVRSGSPRPTHPHSPPVLRAPPSPLRNRQCSRLDQLPESPFQQTPAPPAIPFPISSHHPNSPHPPAAAHRISRHPPTSEAHRNSNLLATCANINLDSDNFYARSKAARHLRTFGPAASAARNAFERIDPEAVTQLTAQSK